jgi:uncharacterized membrane protein
MTINRRQVMTFILIVSLGFNLLIIGGIAARVLSRPEGRPIPPNLAWVVRNLDQETASRLRPTLEEYGAAARPLRVSMFRAQRHINQLIAEEPMQKEAIAQAFDELRQAGLEYQEMSHNQTISLFEMLAPEQRIAAMSFMNDRRNPNDSGRRDRTENDGPREPH